jgi:uncharacterized protein
MGARLGTVSAPFRDVISSLDELRSLYRAPGAGALNKEIDHLDSNCQAFIAHSTFLLVATSGADGSCDVSPKGGPPGFVRVLDPQRVAVPDLAGNNRLDSFSNLLSNPGIGLLFVIPGLDETLRVNGQAWLVQDSEVLDACAVGDVRPRLAVGVAVSSAYIHCAKAFRRGSVWSPADWPDRSDLPTIGCMLRDHLAEESLTGEVIDAGLEAGYAKTMWKTGG